MGGTSVDAPKVNLMATSLMASRPTRSTIQGTRDANDGGFEAMIEWLLERGLAFTASVDGYCAMVRVSKMNFCSVVVVVSVS